MYRKLGVIKLLSIILASFIIVSFSSCKKKQKGEESTVETDSSNQQSELNENSKEEYPIDSSNSKTTEESKKQQSKPAGDAGGEDFIGDDGNAPTDAQVEDDNNDDNQKETVKITFQEGMSMTQVFKRLSDAGVSSFNDLMNTAKSYDYSYYPLIAAQPSNDKRAFKLEGYLFPETYIFYKNMKPQDAIGKFLRGGKEKVGPKAMARAEAMGYSIDEIMTVASIIQREGSNPSQVKNVAGVIYNRLKRGQKLEMDSTITYIERDVKPYLDGDVNRYNSYYNTYKTSKLPAGPICNPGLDTIDAALYPAEHSYYYFCHDSSGNYYYAETYEEHQNNLVKAGLTA